MLSKREEQVHHRELEQLVRIYEDPVKIVAHLVHGLGPIRPVTS